MNALQKFTHDSTACKNFIERIRSQPFYEKPIKLTLKDGTKLKIRELRVRCPIVKN